MLVIIQASALHKDVAQMVSNRHPASISYLGPVITCSIGSSFNRHPTSTWSVDYDERLFHRFKSRARGTGVSHPLRVGI